MTPFDWAVVVVYCMAMVVVGVYFSRQASKTPEHFFIGGRNMPWWLVGFADVSSYGAGCAPFVMLFFIGGFLEYWLVAWVSWCIWMPLVAVIWAKRWRRLGVVTTGEFIELRYGGSAASIYRAGYAIYAYMAWAVVLLAYASVWFTQTISPILDWSPLKVLVVFGSVTLLYTLLSGFIGVVYTELIQFFLIMGGGLVFMIIAIAQAGGLEFMYAAIEANRGTAFLQPLPIGQRISLMTLLALAIQGFFFAGSPFAGEGWTAQRAMAARNERHAIMGQILNCGLSLVIRLIPAVFIGMAAAAMYPVDSVEVPAQLWARMVRDYAPIGVLGFLFAGALAGFMSAVSSTINWGSSYLMNDFYRRHLRKNASSREYILFSRVLCIVTVFVAASLALSIDPRKLESWALFINSALIVFSLPLAWLKWFWWRMNVYGDAAGMLGAFPLAFVVWFGSDTVLPESFRTWVGQAFGCNLNQLIPAFGDISIYPFWYGFTILFVSGWAIILLVTLLTRPERPEVLKEFYIKARPMGWWRPVALSLDPNMRIAILKETKRDLWACFWGIACCFVMVIGFFSLAGRRTVLGFVCCALTLIAGYSFWRAATSAGSFKKDTPVQTATAPEV